MAQKKRQHTKKRQNKKTKTKKSRTRKDRNLKYQDMEDFCQHIEQEVWRIFFGED